MHKVAEVKVSYRPNKLKGTVAIKEKDMAVKILKDNWNKGTLEYIEEFKTLLLNNSNEILGIYTSSIGGQTGTLVDIKVLFAVILKSGATAIITAHNHPSGKLKFSNADLEIENKIKEACNIFNINYLDNLIITKETSISTHENN